MPRYPSVLQAEAPERSLVVVLMAVVSADVLACYSRRGLRRSVLLLADDISEAAGCTRWYVVFSVQLECRLAFGAFVCVVVLFCVCSNCLFRCRWGFSYGGVVEKGSGVVEHVDRLTSLHYELRRFEGAQQVQKWRNSRSTGKPWWCDPSSCHSCWL